MVLSHAINVNFCYDAMLYIGHQQLINQVSFSPDARLIASASFDKSVKLWDGKSGKSVKE